MGQGQLVAAITGDINASSKLPEKEARQLEGLLRQCYEKTAAALDGAELQGFTTFRGDAWQFVAGNPAAAPRAALLFRAYLLTQSDAALGRRLHTAAAIGFGTIYYLPNDQSQAGGGPAYTLSGKRLDRLRRRLPGMGAAGLGETDRFLDSMLGLIDAIVRHWTAAQAQAVALALQALSQVEIGRQWHPPISQQAVHKHLAAAGWPAIEPALQWTETTINSCNKENSLEVGRRA